MENDVVLVEVADRTAYVTLNRPEALNAINFDMVCRLEEVILDLSERKDLSVVVLRGAGRAFCAGADLKLILSGIENEDDLDRFNIRVNRAINSLEDCSLPVVAVVHDLALAGGFEILQACDIVLAAETARLGDQHANFWLIPGGGGSQRLRYILGVHRAKDILLTGRWLSGQEAWQMGLVSRAVPAEELESCLKEVIDTLCQKSPATLKAMKGLINHTYKSEIRKGLEHEKSVFMHYIQGPAPKEGLRAFGEGEKPKLANIGL